MKTPPLARFEEKYVVDNNGCWIWTAFKNKDGYGYFRVDGETVRAHRWSYEHFVGPIPSRLETDHLCRVRSCVNPDHLEPVTHLENVQRGDGGQCHARKTHCPQHHPYDKANTYLTRNGKRHCRECKRKQSRIYQRRRREAA